MPWRDGFQGEFSRYPGLFTTARPVQQRLPLKIGAMTEPGSFRLAGRW
jgi:5,10-methylenetetrahydromethanopterin reductase